MAVIRLEGCKHAKVVPFGEKFGLVTCLYCYDRLQLRIVNSGRIEEADPAWPPPPCSHTERDVIQKLPNETRDHIDVVCRQCGRVMRHLNQKGAWFDVKFYDLLIHEEGL